MPTEVLDVAVVAKIDKLRSELEKIPGITAKESKKMAAVWFVPGLYLVVRGLARGLAP